MSNFICNKRGISMVEVIVSLATVTIGILALLTLLPSSWRLAGRSDYLGRASGILQTQLQLYEAMVLNPSVSLTPGTQPPLAIYPSEPGKSSTTGRQGDVPFRVNTTLADLGGGNAWLVRVNVTWPGNPAGISESIRVVRQENFRQ